jgi:hypothetical protein
MQTMMFGQSDFQGVYTCLHIQTYPDTPIMLYSRLEYTINLVKHSTNSRPRVSVARGYRQSPRGNLRGPRLCNPGAPRSNIARDREC